jgi:DNA-binding transcriptional LysR family regulator
LAQRILNDLQLGVTSLRQQAGQPVGQIIVSSVLSLAAAVLPELLATFGRRYPGIQVHLREGIQADVIDEVRSGLADFAIGYVEGLAENLLVDGLRNERFHVVMPMDHPLASRRRLQLRDLAEATFVSFPRESRSRQVADAAARALGLTLRYTMTVNRLSTLLALVRNRIGLAIVTASECPGAAARLATRPLAGASFACRLGILRARGRELSPAAAIFLVVVQRWLREQGSRGRRG